MKFAHRFTSFIAVLILFTFFIAPLARANEGVQELWQQQQAAYDPDLFSGAAGYSVPITIPQGRGGLTPQISLQYSSMNTSTQNIAGYGWDLGLSRIVREKRTSVIDIYNDGGFRLELNGQQISLEDVSLSSGQYGTYGAKVETGEFLDLEFNSNNSWTVTTKQGLIMTFGTSSSTRMDNPSDSSQVFAWYLEDIRDLNDNYISFEYYKDGAAVYPKKINYTGNDTTDGPFTVRFEPFATGTPSVRDDVSTSYVSGFEVEYQYLLESIEVDVSGVTGSVLEYDLAYTSGDNGKRSLLSSVTKNGKDASGTSISLEPWEFEYSVATDSWTNEGSTFDFPGRHMDADGSVLGDFTVMA